jgi:putative glutamine amidotransferase
MKLVIGLSFTDWKNPKSLNYKRAIEKAAERIGNEVEVVSLSENPERMKDVDGVLFTGGSDVAPSRYGKANELHLCEEIDEKRDHEEFLIADEVEKRELPVLGICRGAQLLNVHKGGTLVTDVEHFGGQCHKKLDAVRDRRHNIDVTPGSLIARILRKTEGEVNSAHHQAIERIGDGLQATARATDDGTVEAIEYADPTDRPFFLAVQWHPERMDFDEPFAGQLLETFIWETAAYKLLKHRMEGVKGKHMNEGHEPIVPWSGE